MNKTIKGILITVIILIIAGFIVIPKINWNEDKPVTSNSPAGPQASSILPVDVSIVKPVKVENSIRITGAILANESVEIKSEISGKIEKIYFKEGQEVKKGQLLLSINDDEILAQIERLKYTRKLNEDNEYRQRQLLDKEAISREEYEIAQTTLNTTLAQIKELEARLAKHHIVAPFDGIIGLRQVSEGSYISSSDLVCNLYNINPIKIEFSVPGKYSADVKIGDIIDFTVEVSGQDFTGKVYAIEPRIDPQTRTMKIRAICPNEKKILLPGQFAKIRYTLNVIPDALMVPSQSVVPELNGHKLFLYNNGIVNEKSVDIGIRTENKVQIVSGLQPSDTVITTGILQVRQGMPISINEINQ